MSQDLKTRLHEAQHNLSLNKFKSNTDASLFEQFDADLAASKVWISWRCLFPIVFSHHVLIKYENNPSVDSFKLLYNNAFHYAKKTDNVPLFRGMSFGFMIMPCLIVDTASEELIAYATARPRKRFAIFEFPILHELSSGKTYFYEASAIWGMAYFSDMRKIARSLFSEQ